MRNRLPTERLEWAEFQRLLRALDEDADIRWKGFLAMAVSFSLRINDLMKIEWKQVWNGGPVDWFDVVEQKTKKPRKITINDKLKPLIIELHEAINPYDLKKYVFSRNGDKIETAKYMNNNLKRLFAKYNVQYQGGISSHLFRKTFGYRYCELKGFTWESITTLQKVFNHASPITTFIYLGIEQKVIDEVYNQIEI
jgi:integrase